MKVTLLGTGGSAGVPLVSTQPGGFWGNCDPTDPRNRRTRTSALVEVDGRTILIDAGPDLRTQLLGVGLTRLDAVLFTHAHADHVAGIDDLRQANRISGGSIPAFADDPTMTELETRFAYAMRPHSGEFFARPALVGHRVAAGQRFSAAGVEVLAIHQDHGFAPSLGYRIRDFAYSTDVLRMDDAVLDSLEGLKLWVVGCFRRTQHPGHATLDQVLEWVARIRPERTVFTQMGQDLDYATTLAGLPSGVEPGFDGWSLSLG